ncbi:hypothetical protein M2427_008387, partial [Bradyrhizobium sp. BR13661]|nr:hypothetical protein [Bradyrhizobium sp. BR13661]
DASFLVLPQVILEMPVTVIIVSHFRGAVQCTKLTPPEE